MLDFSSPGRVIILLGLLLVAVGFFITLLDSGPGWLGNLPGDIRYEGDNFTIYIPLTTMIIISIVINLLLRIISRL